MPNAAFIQADALSFEYPKGINIIFAFASLLHVSSTDIKKVFEKGSECLSPGGIYYISLKEKSEYAEEVKTDKYGERMFYYYSSTIIEDIAADWFDAIHTDRQQIGQTPWFTIVLKKR